ncbi:hypothetical protein BKH46_08730 [Helicobacter sp. 12S02634-8]|uniref:hypothetical protein n=1 Tax=Helicobacter sp. 12S02634-8 TaxID=1476199 RepID=UPI000BC6ACEA|nr:hypothetical protein [Helicobacter sp. 12S02634-8]PAF46153.1 hypothetical protein BKH46_08730 [Helicobacter sp. 12S02634-8]
MKKYRLTDETIQLSNKTLYRIIALKDFDGIKEGDQGGFIESEENLSQDNTAWVYPEGRVFGKAKILEEAKIYQGIVGGTAIIRGNTLVSGISAQVFTGDFRGDALISEANDFLIVESADRVLITFVNRFNQPDLRFDILDSLRMETPYPISAKGLLELSEREYRRRGLSVNVDHFPYDLIIEMGEKLFARRSGDQTPIFKYLALAPLVPNMYFVAPANEDRAKYLRLLEEFMEVRTTTEIDALPHLKRAMFDYFYNESIDDLKDSEGHWIDFSDFLVFDNPYECQSFFENNIDRPSMDLYELENKTIVIYGDLYDGPVIVLDQDSIGKLD